MSARMNLPRDGVINASGLSAEFRFVRTHACLDWSVIETPLGQTSLPNAALTYDPPDAADKCRTPLDTKIVE